MNAWKRITIGFVFATSACLAGAQIPDLFSSYEMGGRGMGMGGSIYSNASDATASYWNPAGLAHIKTPVAEFTLRNRPSNNTTLSGNFNDPIESNSPQFGRNGVSFGGVAVPFRGGTIGLSYALGGYSRQLQRGQGLIIDPDQNITANVDTRDAFVNEFITLAYGMSRGDSLSIGFGLVVGRQSIMERSKIDLFQNGNPIQGGQDTNESESANGIGGIVGVQLQPRNNPNVSYGMSFRSPIKVNGFDAFSSFSDTIPGRFQAGILFRKDGMRGGRDYLIGGIDAAYFLPCNSGLDLERKGYISGGVGFEYNLAQAYGYLPIRVGAHATQEGGTGFINRTVITFGLGYRPTGGRFTIDFSGASGSGSTHPDFAITMGYLLGK